MNFILDIGNRQSGKTTRMINFVVDRIKTANKPFLYITAHNRSKNQIAKILNRKISKKYRNLYNVVVYSEINNLKGHITTDLNQSMFFYDDIDLYIDRINNEWFTAKGYYTSTVIVGKSFKETVSYIYTKILN